MSYKYKNVQSGDSHPGGGVFLLSRTSSQVKLAVNGMLNLAKMRKEHVSLVSCKYLRGRDRVEIVLRSNRQRKIRYCKMEFQVICDRMAYFAETSQWEDRIDQCTIVQYA